MFVEVRIIKKFMKSDEEREDEKILNKKLMTCVLKKLKSGHLRLE